MASLKGEKIKKGGNFGYAQPAKIKFESLNMRPTQMKVRVKLGYDDLNGVSEKQAHHYDCPTIITIYLEVYTMILK